MKYYSISFCLLFLMGACSFKSKPDEIASNNNTKEIGQFSVDTNMDSDGDRGFELVISVISSIEPFRDFFRLVPKTRLELVRIIHPWDFKSHVSTIPPPGQLKEC